MNAAISRALKAVNGHEGVRNYRHVAVVRNGKSTWIGLNSTKTHPQCLRERKGIFFSTTHAEEAAIFATPEHLRVGAEIFVLRVNASGDLRNSRPCESCLEVIRSCGLEKVHFSTDDGSIVTEEL